MEEKGSFVRCQKPAPLNWYNHAIGRSGMHLASIVSNVNSEPNGKGPEIRVELYLLASGAKVVEKWRFENPTYAFEAR